MRHLITSNPTFTVTHYKGTRQEKHDAWLEGRTHGVGGSDMATILGFNHYKTAYALWMEKTGKTTPENIDNKWAVVKGRTLEKVLRDRYKSLHPELEVWDGTDKALTSVQHPCMVASLDGYTYDPATGEYAVLEIKTANSMRAKDWYNTDGNLKVPIYYLTQVMFYMAVTGWNKAVVYADIGDSEPVEVTVQRDEEDVQTIINACEQFWQHVTEDTPPELTGVFDVQLAYPQDDGTLEQVTDSEFNRLAGLYRQLKYAANAANSQAKTIKNQLAVMVGERKGLISDQYKVTYTTTTRSEHVVKASTSRVMRVTCVNKQ